MKKLLSSDLLPLGVAVLLGPLFVFPRGQWMWILLAVPLAWLGSGLLGKSWMRRAPLDAAIAVLVLWGFFSLLGVPEIEGSISKAAGFVYGITVFYAVVMAAKSGRRIKLGIGVFLAASFVIALVGTLNRVDFRSVNAIDSRKVFSVLPKVDLNIERAEQGINPNPLGGTLVLFIPLGLMMIPGLIKKDEDDNKRGRKVFLAIVLLIVVVDLGAVFFGRSFGAWSALLISLLILGRKKIALKAALGVVLIAAIAIFWLKLDKPVPAHDNSLRGVLVHSVSSRYHLWSAGIAAVKEKPVFGVGMDQLRLREDVGYSRAHAHNQFLNTAAEMGIPALAAYLAILIGAGWMTVRVEKSSKPGWMKDAARGLAVGQVGFAIFGMLDAIVLGAKPGLFFWVSLSLITAIYLAPDENGEKEAVVLCS